MVKCLIMSMGFRNGLDVGIRKGEGRGQKMVPWAFQYLRFRHKRRNQTWPVMWKGEPGESRVWGVRKVFREETQQCRQLRLGQDED